MILRRTSRSLDANPLTYLPGNASIMEEIQRVIDEENIFAIGYADLGKFKNYNDKYGFERGDDVIKESARILIRAVREKCGPNCFIGHIGGDDFVFIAPDELMDQVCATIIREFDQKVPSFYSEEDRKAGFILGKDRQGNEQKVNLLTISIGIVSNACQKITHVAQVAQIGAELKSYAKSFEKSVFVRNKRKG